MCYSAQIEAQLKLLRREEGITLDYVEAERLFLERLANRRIKIPRAFEANFDNPGTPAEVRIKGLIDQYRSSVETELQQDLFKQARRLADAQRALQSRETKKTREDVRIATSKIDANRERLSRLRAADIDVDDGRIFPFWYAPIIINRSGEKVMTLARYHLRQKGSPEFIDRKYPGLYNAFGAFLVHRSAGYARSRGRGIPIARDASCTVFCSTRSPISQRRRHPVYLT